MDVLEIKRTLGELNAAWMRNAEGLSAYCRAFGQAVLSTRESVNEHLRNVDAETTADNGDAFMADLTRLAWSSQQYHRVLRQWLIEYVNRAPNLDADVRQRALFWVRQFVDMLTPSNFFWTNPRAVQRFLKSEGESLIHGMRHYLDDLQENHGLPRLSDPDAFRLGQNLAVTPGRVVFRNHLMEVIQYAPQTELTWQIPLVLVQPWINKYYIFDLTPRNSFVNYLVRQGFTVFITSWKNPTREMSGIDFDDYMLSGALQAVNVARDICGSRQVHAAGYCIGGTLLGALLGWLAHEKEDSPIADATFFAALLDFAEPGDLKVFINPSTLAAVEQRVAADGVLERHYIALAFRLLNSGDLIWRSILNNYVYGDCPPRSDMLYWNSDGTNLPGAMCMFYLNHFYRENRMARPGALTLGDRSIDLKQVRLPIYAVGAAKDHICPWPGTFQTCRLTGGKVRYVLADEGHITGIVNPPSPWSKKTFRAGAATRRRNAERWLKDRKARDGSWWPDWIAWLKPRSGAQAAPPPLGTGQYPALETAPGIYVLE